MKALVGKAITLAAILALMAVSAVSLSSCGTDPIAEIPDPEYFYAETGLIDEINEHDDVKQVILRSDGDCDTCGGDGLLHSSASDEEDRNCDSCSGSGNCRSCGGDGEL